MMVYLQVENLTKSFGDRLLFENISFGIDQGQRVALIAQNGTGKTTLLNLLTGRESQDGGTITYRRDIRVGCLTQDPDFQPGMTVSQACFASDNDVVKAIALYENLISKLSTSEAKGVEPSQLSILNSQLQLAMADMDRLNAWDYEVRIKQILGKLNIHNLEQPVEQLSGGQQKRLALANVLITEPDLILLDEPTNHLDLEMVEWLEEFLNHSKMTILMVTHDRYFLDNVCTDILEIDQHQLFHYKGNYSYYLEKREARIANFNAETARAQNLYRTELDWMRRQPQARGHKSRSRIDAFYEIEQRAKQRIVEKQVSLGVKSAYLGSKIFEAQYISKAFGDYKILDNFYYNFSRYEKLGIVGKNGTGKSTFLKMLLGEVAPDSGRFDIGETVKFAYYSQSGIQFNDGMKVIDAVRQIAEEVDLGGGRKMTATQFLTHFLFPPEKQHDYIAKLSGGERRRLYLCTVLMRSPNFIILDEPTNDLDIATLNVLEDYLISFKGCVIVVSHDRFFMDKVVDHMLVFQGDCKIKDFPGNYTDYRQWKELKDEEERELAELEKKSNQHKQATTQQPKNSNAEGKRKLSFNEKREYEQLTKDIESLEKEKSELESALASGSLSNDELLQKSQRFQEVTDLLDEKELRWLELDELN
ncbi:MAG: ABC-F family ATP-binding cassette domain-containing protein [Paludibacteraceae bacterium]|nr:ABC-F family ATP-binding cassette domain-containing protein [Paludibacteraceae bacterium]